MSNITSQRKPEHIIVQPFDPHCGCCLIAHCVDPEPNKEYGTCEIHKELADEEAAVRWFHATTPSFAERFQDGREQW